MKERFKFLGFLSSIINSIILNIFTLILAVLMFCSFPFIIILSIPLFIVRSFVANIAKFVRRDLSKMLTTRGHLFATDDLHVQPKCNVLVAMTVEGNMNMDKVFENASRTILEAKFPSGDLKYPELKQYLVKWFGYYFWKQDYNFDVKNHFKLYEKCELDNSKRFSDEDVQEIRQEMVEKKWDKKIPLWELIFITNCYPLEVENPGPHTTVILRFHHTLGDGYSWLILLIEGLCEKPIVNAVPNYFKRDPCSLILYWIAFPFRAAFEGAGILINAFFSVPFKVTKDMQTGRANVNLTRRIPLCKIKEIKSHFKVSFSSVVFAVLAGAVRDIMIQKRIKVPMYSPAITALPLPGHSIKLRNFMTGAITKLPTGESDPIKRLKLSQKDYKSIKRSTAPIFMWYLCVLIGSYFQWMTKALGDNMIAGIGLSNFPAGFEYMSYDGHKCVDCVFFAGVQTGCLGLGFAALSYVDGFRISPLADAAMFSKDEVKDIARLIEKHIDILHQHAITDV